MAKSNVSETEIKATREAGGKRAFAIAKGVDRTKAYAVDDAVKLIKDRAKAKFDETIEISMNLGVDPKHADQMVRGVCNLPNGSGRTARVAVFARGAKAEEAKAAGADMPRRKKPRRREPTLSAPKTSWRRCRRGRSTSIAASRRPT